MRGIFITFEGGEGSGKTTLLEGIYENLLKRGFPLLKTREPGGTHVGEAMRNLVLHDKERLAPYTELCIYLASRAQHVADVILPALRGGKIVLCDRFNDSTVAYQGYARGLGMVLVGRFCNFIAQDLRPDLTICLDLDPSIGLARLVKKSKNSLDKIENENVAFHQKVRDGFHLIAEEDPTRFKMIDGEQDEKDVLAQAMNLINPICNNLRK